MKYDMENGKQGDDVTVVHARFVRHFLKVEKEMFCHGELRDIVIANTAGRPFPNKVTEVSLFS